MALRYSKVMTLLFTEEANAFINKCNFIYLAS